MTPFHTPNYRPLQPNPFPTPCPNPCTAELNVMDPDIVPMFFQDPERILNHFMEIEENNLFLIQVPLEPQ